jgi:N,N-dimethylformamidase beta subunit-like protein
MQFAPFVVHAFGYINNLNSSDLAIPLSTSNLNISILQSPITQPNVTSPLSIASTMRNMTLGTASPGNYPYIAPNNNYVFSQNKSEITSPSNNSHTGEYAKGKRLAAVMPTFTAAAYNNFYKFYQKYINTRPGVNITTDLNLLSSNVTNAPSASASGFAMIYLLANLKWISPQSEVTFLTDEDVDGGGIFQTNGSNIFDVLILGHQEYVTQNEYDNLKRFVSAGGTLILLDGNVFYAEVKYDKNVDKITLVKGHSWAFNGKSAWRSISERWRNETAQWIGSNYISFPKATFVNDPFSYAAHEEQYLTNPKDIILLNYNASIPVDNTTIPSRQVVATYELNYLKGKVIALGLYSDDIIANGSFNRYFDNLLLHYAFVTSD